MAWVTAILGGASGGYSAYASSRAASKDKLDPGRVPEWWEDPYYKSSQEKLSSFGGGLLEGKLPDFYSSLGKTKSPEFNDMLRLINRDTAAAINENMVRRNISRGGVGANLLATTMADTNTKMRWQDLLNANQEKMGLMNTGVNTLSGVRGAALDMTGQKNQFNINQANMNLMIDQYNAKAKAAKEMMWANIISSVIGGATSGYMAGKGLGSAQTSNSNSSGNNGSFANRDMGYFALQNKR